MRDIFKKQEKMKYYIFFVMLTLLQLATIIYAFTKKEGCHSDELWSYGYANYYYGGDIYNRGLDKVVFRDEWVDSEMFRDYLMVNENERFSYGSVYYNMKNGEHPPLHSMILHTICSFFPGEFSLWYSFSINLMSFIVCMVFLFKLTTNLKNEKFALLCCALYGFSFGARNTFIYLRMYALGTALLMVVLYNMNRYIDIYIHTKKYSIKHVIGLFISCFLAFYTNFFLIAFIGVLTLFYCIYLLIKRKMKGMLVFGSSILCALGVMLCLFPNTISRIGRQIDVSNTITSNDYAGDLKSLILLNFLTKADLGLSFNIFVRGRLGIAIGYIIYGIVICIPILFLVEKKKIWEKINIGIHRAWENMKAFCINGNWFYVFVLFASIIQLVIVGKAVNIFHMGIFADRYIFYLFPVSVILVVGMIDWFAYCILKKERVRKGIVLVLLAFFILQNVRMQKVEQAYFFKERYEGMTLIDAIHNKNVILMDDEKHAWFMVALSDKMMHTKQFFRVYKEEYTKYGQEYLDKIKEEPVILLLNQECVQEFKDFSGLIDDYTEESYEIDDNEIMEYFKGLDQNVHIKEISRQMVFTRQMIAYEISKE